MVISTINYVFSRFKKKFYQLINLIEIVCGSLPIMWEIMNFHISKWEPTSSFSLLIQVKIYICYEIFLLKIVLHSEASLHFKQWGFILECSFEYPPTHPHFCSLFSPLPFISLYLLSSLQIRNSLRSVLSFLLFFYLLPILSYLIACVCVF